MEKQSNIFTGVELSAIEKHQLEIERRNKLLNDMGAKIIDNKKKGKRKKIENCKYLRTEKGIYELKEVFRHYFIAENIKTKKEDWLTENIVLDYADKIYQLLKVKDVIQYKNANRYSIGVVKNIVRVYRYKEEKIIVEDNYNHDKYVISNNEIISVVGLCND